MTIEVDYYLFLVSPWSYLATRRANEVYQKHQVKVNYKPIDVMKTFQEMGGTPLPKRHPSRLQWRLDELTRWSEFLNMPINLQPAHFPADQSLAAGMVLLASDEGDAGPLVDAILAAVWRDEKNIADSSTLVTLANDCDLDGESLVELAGQQDVQTRYEETTCEAHQRGVFGSPTWIYRDELFWGQDRIDFLDRALST